MDAVVRVGLQSATVNGNKVCRQLLELREMVDDVSTCFTPDSPAPSKPGTNSK